MKINTTIFELNVLVSNMTHATVWDMCCMLKDAKNDLDFAREVLIENTFAFGQNVEELASIDEQLSYVNRNIKTLEEALMCFETKLYDKRLALGELQTIWNN